MKAPKGGLAFCETVTATGPGPWHVRRVPAGEDLRLGGGVDRPALCGRDLHRGWDLEPPVTIAALDRIDEVDAWGRPGVCPTCNDHARQVLGGGAT